MKLLHEASVRFELHEKDDEAKTLVLNATLVGESLKPGDTKAPVTDLMAAAAYRLYLEGVIAEKMKEMFGVSLDAPQT